MAWCVSQTCLSFWGRWRSARGSRRHVRRTCRILPWLLIVEPWLLIIESRQTRRRLRLAFSRLLRLLLILSGQLRFSLCGRLGFLLFFRFLFLDRLGLNLFWRRRKRQLVGHRLFNHFRIVQVFVQIFLDLNDLIVLT